MTNQIQSAAALALRDFVEVYEVVIPFIPIGRAWAEKMAEKAVAETFVGPTSSDNMLVTSGRGRG